MQIVETLAPIILLLALGAALARGRFLGREFMIDLNRLVFYLALPSLIFMSIASAEEPADDTVRLIGVLAATTLLAAALAWVLAVGVLRLPGAVVGTFVQSAFRGNFLFVGLPILTYALADLGGAERERAMATIFLAITPIMALYNVLAVIVLQASRHRLGRGSFVLMGLSMARNPLIIACLAGLVFMAAGWSVPVFIGRSLEALGGAAVPVALLCIGGSLHSLRLVGNRRAIVATSIVKVFVGPVIAYAIGSWAGIVGVEMRILLVFAACPTAAAAFIMSKQMGGDESLAAGSIALSTLLSVVSLALALAVT